MVWYYYLARFIAGMFLANSVPHLVNGISGRRFQSPFASPPGVGESAPLVNAVWGLVNAFIGLVLLFAVGRYQVGMNVETLLVGLGFALTALALAWHFGRVRAG
jgi:hypothetical protein